MIKKYYALTKPGIIYGNCLTAIGGFLLASKWDIDWLVFVATIGGMSLVIASGCVFNNLLDRNIDSKMARTQKRALVQGSISTRHALIFATVLGCLGIFMLAFYVNILTALIALGAFVAYVVVYGLAKRRTVHGTLVGSISGAAPPVIGYTAVTNSVDVGALALFLILVCWQMPHFYAIAIYRLKDYQAAGIPVLPAIKGTQVTKYQITAYIAAFVACCMFLSVTGYAGFSFGLFMFSIGCIWLYKSWRGLSIANDTKWARQMFGFSLVVLLSLSGMLALSPILP